MLGKGSRGEWYVVNDESEFHRKLRKRKKNGVVQFNIKKKIVAW